MFTHLGKEDILDWLKEDFERHYTTNRAPYTLAMHTNWFTTREQREALEEWLDWVQDKEDVYFVTGTQTLLWMLDPTPVKDIKNFEPWQCENKPVSDRHTDNHRDRHRQSQRQTHRHTHRIIYSDN